MRGLRIGLNDVGLILGSLFLLNDSEICWEMMLWKR
jgi:hypothetical protein